jgi:hypothetical protein
VIRDRAAIRATISGTVNDLPYRWLGHSPEVLVDLHPPWVPEITGGQMALVWRDFSKTVTGQNPIDPSLQDEMSFLDMSLPEGPVIYLNERPPDCGGCSTCVPGEPASSALPARRRWT